MKVRATLGIAALLLVGSWMWIGFDKYIGDHEVGSAWEPFLKSRPTFTLLFTNPAQQGLDRDAFDTMDSARQQAFRDYCAVRFGIADPYRCEKAIEERRL
ncbi:hypothetical protein [Paracidovorax cattleyae]|uniref:Uncharacterized protein n=1 Tax=Paracidovorax cattleyae TaxID=80868 RepID=A0A1H0QFH3_9BURK|nr:hypothetical protein [Paracidovorax cattleyae]MBF9266783.1 hypothetical protein [Paracidovorax cattleyae]SDP16092.1 hypothetical protein SAMN04489708_10885 [Paracidovorax cattleyae]